MNPPILLRLDRLYKQLGNARNIATDPAIISVLSESMDVIADVMVGMVREAPAAADVLAAPTTGVI